MQSFERVSSVMTSAAKEGEVRRARRAETANLRCIVSVLLGIAVQRNGNIEMSMKPRCLTDKTNDLSGQSTDITDKCMYLYVS